MNSNQVLTPARHQNATSACDGIVKAVLFVDDEQPLLDGLRGLLRKQRGAWHMEFVASGEAALAMLQREPFDVVISDMRMPGIDGATLLQSVRDRYPRIARVILSGQSSQEELLRGIPAMQQFLTKPCDPVRLKEAVQRLCRVQDLLANESIRAAIGSMERLLSFPGSYQELVAAAGRNDTSEEFIVAIVERDPALSVRVLQLANSVHYRVGRPVSAVRSAMRVVGLSTLKALALSTQVFGSLDPLWLQSEPLRSLPWRALLKAQLAREFVGDRSRADEAFTAALLLDVGQIVLAGCCRDSFRAALQAATQTGRPQQELEREHCSVGHDQAGAYFLALWGMPATLVDIVGSHHDPALLQSAGDAFALSIHAADVLVDSIYAGADDALQTLHPRFEKCPELALQLDQWRERARAGVADMQSNHGARPT